MPEPMNPLSENSELALRKYDVVLKLHVMDTQIYWTRSQLFLVANAALVGFELNSVPVASDAHTIKILALAGGAITGVILCMLWIRGLRAGEGWMKHWKNALSQWEKLAFGGVNLYFERPPDVPRSSAVARSAARLFLALWCIISAYVALCLYLRITGCPLP